MDYVKLEVYRIPRRLAGTSGVVGTIVGFKVRAQTQDDLAFLANEIFIRRAYDVPLAERPALIIDCGANVGISVLFFKWRWPKAAVEAIEPGPAAFSFLRENVESGGLADVRLHAVALGSAEGSATLRLPELKSASVHASLVGRSGSDSAEVVVDVCRLSRIIAGRNVDLLKIDIEGYEGIVIDELVASGAIRHVRAMVIEYTHGLAPHGTGSRLLEVLDENGFEYEFLTQETSWRRHGRGSAQDVLLFAERKVL